MAWIKVPPEHRPIFHDALPDDPRVVTTDMFGGIAARVNGNIFAGLFQRSVALWLGGDDRKAALALEGAGPFDPMGNGRAISEKVMMPESLMEEPEELRRWIGRAFAHTLQLRPKEKTARARTAALRRRPAKVKRSTP